MTKIMPLTSIAKNCRNYTELLGRASILETKPIKVPQKIVQFPKPFIIDAKTCLAKIKIKPEFDKVKFDYFLNGVIEEINNITREENRPFLQKINPINFENINDIKEKLKFFTEGLKPTLEHEISDCHDPEKLFDIIKNNFTLISTNTQNIPPEEFIQMLLSGKINKLRNNLVRKMVNFIDIFTPKSTEPRALKLEDEVRTLGVKNVNFSNDLERAQEVKKVIEEVREKGIPLPYSITVTPILPPRGSGATAIEINGADSKSFIVLKTSLENEISAENYANILKYAKSTKTFKHASPEYQSRCLSSIQDIVNNEYSTKNPNHVIYHEIAHAFQSEKIPELTNEEIEIAKEVSLYAGKQLGKEIMPELFAMLMDGQKLTDKQMALYLKLGGIVPKINCKS